MWSTRIFEIPIKQKTVQSTKKLELSSCLLNIVLSTVYEAVIMYVILIATFI